MIGAGCPGFTERGRRDGGHDHVARPWAVRECLDGTKIYLGDMLAVRLDQPGRQPYLGRDLAYRLQRGPP